MWQQLVAGKDPFQRCATWTRCQPGAADDQVCFILQRGKPVDSGLLSYFPSISQLSEAITGTPVVVLGVLYVWPQQRAPRGTHD